MDPHFVAMANAFACCPYLRKALRARSLHRWERGTSGRWHIHCAIELPPHFDAFALETLIGDCWAKVELGYGRILVRDGANGGWINYMLKDRQKSEFDGILDCVMIKSMHNPIADAQTFVGIKLFVQKLGKAVGLAIALFPPIAVARHPVARTAPPVPSSASAPTPSRARDQDQAG